MMDLPNGCRCSDISIHPENWNTKRASLRKLWYLQYRFYDPKNDEPRYTGGMLRIVKAGVNAIKTLEERQFAIKYLLQSELSLLKEQGYNPMTGKSIPPPIEEIGEISAQTFFVDALRFCLQNVQAIKQTKDDMESAFKYIQEGIFLIGYNYLQIGQVKKQAIKLLLDCMQKKNISKVYDDGHKKPFSDEKYNKYRAYLSMLFAVMEDDLGIIEYNPVEKVKKRKTVKKIRETLSIEDRKRVNDHLFTYNRDFWRYVQIFFHSGARIRELQSIKGKDVDLSNQRYKVLIRKGGAREEWKIIKDIALPFWDEQMKNCGPVDYVFSTLLKPGAVPLAAHRISKLWKFWVKDQLNVTADIYSLKHSNSSEIVDALNEFEAAKLNSHKSTAMVVKIYDTKQKSRKDEKLKSVNNSFC